MPSYIDDSQFRPQADVPMYVSSATTSSERRINPTWSLSQFKTRMEPVTGIPAESQSVTVRVRRTGDAALRPSDSDNLNTAQQMLSSQSTDDTVTMGELGLFKYGEIYITDTRPAGQRSLIAAISLDPAANPDGPTLAISESHYESLPNTIRAYKKANRLGRFDPAAPAKLEAARQAQDNAIEDRKIVVGGRCRIGADDTKRGTVRFVGPIDSLPGPDGVKWVGVELDEPSGRNDGSVVTLAEDGDTDDDDDDDDAGKSSSTDGTNPSRTAPPPPGLVLKKKKKPVTHRIFTCPPNRGLFVRPDRVEIGQFDEIDTLDGLLDSDDDMAEI